VKKLQYIGLLFSLGILASGGVVSCTDFFSTSLAPWASRDPASVIPAIDANNVNDLIALSENNPDMSLEVLNKITAAIQDAGEDDASSLRAAALQAAANASSLGPTLLNKAGDISGVIEDPDGARNLIIDTINDMPNLEATRDALNSILPEDGPAFDAFVEKASADDLAIAAAVLLAAEAKVEIDSGDYINNFDPENPNLSSSALLAVSLATEASKKYAADDSGSRLKEILDGLNLAVPVP
jgi:hypothetical protein